jgi:hypothetical protein
MLQMKKKCCWFAGYPGNQIKTQGHGAGRDHQIADCPKQWSACAADVTGPASKDVGDQLTKTTTRLRKPGRPLAFEQSSIIYFCCFVIKSSSYSSGSR